MRLKHLVFFLTSLPFLAQAQIPDSVFYDLIQTNISDASSYLYYPTLTDKYENNPGGMNSEESLHLYFGRKFQNFYDPVNNHTLYDDVTNSFYFDLGDSVDYQAIQDLCLQILEDELINLNIQKTLIYVSKMLQDPNHDLYYSQYQTAIAGILESQDYIDDFASFLITNNDDVMHVLQIKDWKYLGEMKVENREEKVKIENNNQVQWINFNIGPELDYLSNM
jgi:hypothetical protein